MSETELPSTQRLLKSTILALLAAMLILVAIVLPAEYGVDPLRIGGLLGLTEMAKAKSVAPPVAAAPTANATSVMHAHQDKYHSGRVEIKVNGREELEYKAVLPIGEPMLYTWTVQGGDVYSEFHGEPTEGTWPKDFYQSYLITERTAAERGSFVAPFTGQHGWYWKNLSDDPVTIVLEVQGYYSKLGRVGQASSSAN